MSDHFDPGQVQRMMELCAARLGFSTIELQYIIGRLRTRPVNPMGTEQIAAKLGITESLLCHYETLMADNARLADPMLFDEMAAYLKFDEEVSTKVNQGIAKRDAALVATLTESYVDPTQYPRMPKP